MFNGIEQWGAAEWWLGISIWLFFAICAAYGLVRHVCSRPTWARRMRGLETGRQAQRAHYDNAQREWFTAQRATARDWLKVNDWRGPDDRMETNNAHD